MSLFDLARASETGRPGGEERGATSESLSVAINDYGVDACDLGEAIRSVAVEIRVGDELVLIEIGLPRLKTYFGGEGLGGRHAGDYVTVAKLTVVSGGEVTERDIARLPGRNIPAKYAYRLIEEERSSRRP